LSLFARVQATRAYVLLGSARSGGRGRDENFWEIPEFWVFFWVFQKVQKVHFLLIFGGRRKSRFWEGARENFWVGEFRDRAAQNANGALVHFREKWSKQSQSKRGN